MKIGILTLPLQSNYGGILQAYALQTVLERLGHEVVVFQTYYDGVRKISPKVYPLVLVKRLLRKLFINHSTPIFMESRKRREAPILRKNTDVFIKRYIHCYHVMRLNNIPSSDFDAVIVGSDQIWRPEYVKRMWKTGIQDAFLRFTEGWEIKRIAYAASFGVDIWQLTKDETEECKRLINLFDAVSVREESGVQFCLDNFGIKAIHVLDPTMLLSKIDYLSLTGNYNSVHHSGDLFSYILDETPEKKEFVKRIANERGLETFSIVMNGNLSVPVDKRIIPPVEEWLKCFDDAKFVITDSFHGCVFSIIFGKPFIAIGNASRGMARFKSLLRMFDAEDCLITDVNSDMLKNPPDVSEEKEKRLQILRQKSYSYLTQALKDG